MEGQDPSLSELRSVYLDWRDYAEFLVLQRQEWKGGERETKTIALKCSKRGNDVYRRRTSRRVDGLELNNGADVVFWDWNRQTVKAHVLKIELTYAVERSSLIEAWSIISKDWNRWITRVRKHYGRVSCFRSFEATKRGYPHIHAVLVFQDYEFVATRRISQNGAFTWRVSDEEREELRQSYPAFINVQAVRTWSSAIRYLKKHVTKGTEKSNDKEGGETTLSVLWVFRKRSFSLSRDFAAIMKEKLSDLICALHNSNQSLLTGGIVEVVWVLIGIFGAEELGVDAGKWTHVLEKVPG